VACDDEPAANHSNARKGGQTVTITTSIMMENVGLAVVGATLMSQWLGRKLSLDGAQTGYLTLALNMAFLKLDANLATYLQTATSSVLTFDLLSYGYWICIALCMGLAGYGFYVYYLLSGQKSQRRDGITLNLYLKSHMDTFTEYLAKNPSMCAVPDTMDHGDANLLAQAYAQSVASFTTASGSHHYGPSSYNQRQLSEIQDRAAFIKPKCDVKITFHDPNFNISGHYVWRTAQQEVNVGGGGGGGSSGGGSREKSTVGLPFIEVWIAKASEKLSRPTDYLKSIEEWQERERKLVRTLYFVKIMSDLASGEMIPHHYKIYDGPRLPLADLEKKYMDTFFQTNKERIWNTIKTIDTKPQEIEAIGQFPQCGFLLYGLPGTGKSTFAFRVAMTLGRHIVSINIRTVPNCHTLHQMMRTPIVNRQALTPKDVVFVFDEFDLAVKELARRASMNQNIMDKWMADVGRFESSFNSLELNNDQRQKNIGAMKLSATGYGGNNDIQLHDLLEIFQGVVPAMQSIIIATTNCFEELQRICPALFRIGRLTPVPFHQFDLSTLNQLTNFYFHKSITTTPTTPTPNPNPTPTPTTLTTTTIHDQKDDRVVNLCPSQVIEALCESVTVADDTSQRFQYFEKRLSLFLFHQQPTLK
jgi:hypothetical protein